MDQQKGQRHALQHPELVCAADDRSIQQQPGQGSRTRVREQRCLRQESAWKRLNQPGWDIQGCSLRGIEGDDEWFAGRNGNLLQAMLYHCSVVAAQSARWCDNSSCVGGGIRKAGVQLPEVVRESSSQFTDVLLHTAQSMVRFWSGLKQGCQCAWPGGESKSLLLYGLQHLTGRVQSSLRGPGSADRRSRKRWPAFLLLYICVQRSRGCSDSCALHRWSICRSKAVGSRIGSVKAVRIQVERRRLCVEEGSDK